MLNKLRRYTRTLKIDNFLRKAIRYPLVDPLLSKLFDPRNKKKSNEKIFISGTSRSGSTWLTEILAAIPKSAVLWEPLNSMPPVREGTVDNKKYISQESNKRNQELEACLHQLIELSYLDFHMTRFSSLKELTFAGTYIAKFCRANRLLPWIAEHYPEINLILLVRHPCAVVASQLKHGAWDEILNSDSQFPDPGEGYLEDFPEVRSILDDLKYPEEQLAADWALDYLVPIRYGIPENWLVLTYEEIVADGPKAVEKIFDWLGKGAPQEAFEQLGTASKTVSDDSNVVKGGNPLETWKDRLKPKQADRILKVMERVGMDFYSRELEPDYDKLFRSFRGRKCPEDGEYNNN